MTDQRPTPLTDLRRRAPVARALIRALLAELADPVEIKYDFYREWNGCWKVRLQLSGAVNGQLALTLLDTPGGGMLAMPQTVPAPLRVVGVPATDGTRWNLDAAGNLVKVAP